MKSILLIISLFMSVNVFADITSKQKKEVSKKFEETCYSGYKLGCTELGFLYEEGKDVEKDFNKAVKLYKKSCSSNKNPSGCYTLTNMVSQEELKKYFTKSCNENIGVACFYLAKKEKAKKMADLYIKACDNGYLKGCKIIGKKYLRGSKKSNIEKDRNKGLNLLEKTCEKKYAPACMVLSQFYRNKKKYKESMKYYEKSCDAGSAQNCNMVFAIYYRGQYGFDKNMTKAIEYCAKTIKLTNDYQAHCDYK